MIDASYFSKVDSFISIMAIVNIIIRKAPERIPRLNSNAGIVFKTVAGTGSHRICEEQADKKDAQSIS